MRRFHILEESGDAVLMQGKPVPKYEVPIGREFVENGRLFQTIAQPNFYRLVRAEQRFRYGDQWYYQDPKQGAMKVEPNMPFGVPYHDPNARRSFQTGERVSILEVIDRGRA